MPSHPPTPSDTQPPEIAPGAILATLRERTAAAHGKLEAEVRIGEKIADPALYRQLLTGFLGFYQPMERLITRAGLERWNYHAAARRKCGWLERDLVAMGCLAPRPAECEALPRIDSASRAFGCAYVLEGATLGGRHISRMLEHSQAPRDARRFFLSYGAETGQMWRSFCAALEDFAVTAGRADEIMEAAEGTFTALGSWLSRETR